MKPTRYFRYSIEMYTPRHAVKASVLEKAHGVDGKYTQGLMMTEFCGTGEDEDPVSIGLTSLSRLIYRYNVKFEEVGITLHALWNFKFDEVDIKLHMLFYRW